MLKVKYNLDNDNWSDEQYENQEDQTIEIPLWVIEDYIKQTTNLADNEGVDLILDVKLIDKNNE
ncbi:MAG TPA: hypothetical protein VLA48_02620 [Nitrososphaeraceae archaeon]|nr:hypothetical protein [Nitrososphaeraceae archaeon]